MAIVLQQQVSGVIYPAYNPLWYLWQDDQTGPIDDYSDVSISPASLFPNRFRLYPDTSGQYSFNFRDVNRIIFANIGFEDSAFTTTAGQWGEVVTNLVQTVDVVFYAGALNQNENSLATSYEIYRGVKQIGDPIFTNTDQLMVYSPDGNNFKLSYFEGYPFEFTMQKVDDATDNNVTVKNNGTGVTSSSIGMPINGVGSYRIIVDKGGGTNWNTQNFLALIDGESNLTINVDGVAGPNLTLKKVPSRAGVYLKWANDAGGYSYFLFDEFTKTSIKPKDIGLTYEENFQNFDDNSNKPQSPIKTIGKNYTEMEKVRAVVDNNELEHLRSLMTSPFVQMWSQRTPFANGEWITVNTSSQFKSASKRNLHEVLVDIVKPQRYNITL